MVLFTANVCVYFYRCLFKNLFVKKRVYQYKVIILCVSCVILCES